MSFGRYARLCLARYVGFRPLDMQSSAALTLLDMCRSAARCGAALPPGRHATLTERENKLFVPAMRFMLKSTVLHSFLSVPLFFSGTLFVPEAHPVRPGGVAAGKARPLSLSGRMKFFPAKSFMLKSTILHSFFSVPLFFSGGAHFLFQEPCLSKIRILYSMLSDRALKLASMTSEDTPTVLHSERPSVEVISTRTTAAVAACGVSTRTL